MGDEVKITDNTIEIIRRRPGMYVGALDQAGVHHMLYWAFDDIVANARAGRGHRLKAHFRKDDSCEIFDDGPAYEPTDKEPFDRLDEMTGELLTGPDRGLAPEKQLRAYLPILRALSARMEVTAHVGGANYWRAYEKGEPAGKEWRGSERLHSEHPEMLFSVKFWPDPEIFEKTEVDYEHVRERLQQMAATCPEMEISTSHEIWSRPFGRFTPISMPNGMADMLAEVATKSGEHMFEPSEPFRLRVRQGELAFDVAVQWHWGREVQEPVVLSWANTVKTSEGSHVVGVKEAIRDAGLDDLPHFATVSVFVPQPRFTNPVKDCLRNPEIRVLLRDHLGAALRRLAQDDDFAIRLDYMRSRLRDQGA